MTDKSKILYIVITVLTIALVASIYRGNKKEHEPNYKSQYDSLIVAHDRELSGINERNKFVQDSITSALIIRHIEEDSLKSAVKHNDHNYENKIHLVRDLSLDSSIQLRAKLRFSFRRTYGY